MRLDHLLSKGKEVGAVLLFGGQGSSKKEKTETEEIVEVRKAKTLAEESEGQDKAVGV